MVYEGPPILIKDKETSLVFTVFDSTGKPVKLEPYMGMLGHAVVRRSDGTVFTHLHPMGTISMAAQTILSLKETGQPTVSREPPVISEPNRASFPYAFPREGDYRMWVQVRSKGKVLTGVFDFAVK